MRRFYLLIIACMIISCIISCSRINSKSPDNSDEQSTNSAFSVTTSTTKPINTFEPIQISTSASTPETSSETDNKTGSETSALIDNPIQTAETTPITTTSTLESTAAPTEQESPIDAIINDIYIGEAFKTGFIYLEQFIFDRSANYKLYDFENYPDSLEFYDISGDGVTYKASFNNESSIYVPEAEEDSKYYFQGYFGVSPQCTLCYKSTDEIKRTSVGITFFNHNIESIDFSCIGEERTYSESEYKQALDEVKKTNENRGGLRERTIEDSIIGAKQLCLIYLKDLNIKLLLSKYFSLGFESTADVYVIDFIDENNNVLRTFEKVNGVTY